MKQAGGPRQQTITPGRGRSLACAAIASTLLLASLPARGQDRTLTPAGGGQPSPTKGLEETTKRPYWGAGHRRAFLSAVFEGGSFYVRPQLAFGYGKPHWKWVGVEGQTSLSATGGADYAGIHFASPWVDARVGTRYVFPVNQSFLPRRETYTQPDTEYRDGPTSRYLSLEAELAGALPLFGGSLFAVVTAINVHGVPDGYDLYEETMHVVMEPPYLGRARLGYVYGFGVNGALRLGFATEILGNPGRASYVARVGPVLALTLTHHLEAIASILPVVASRDDLRLRGAEFGQLGLRYKWATGDAYREFP